MQLTHRNIWLNATTFGWHLGVSDRDVYLHTLPKFHCNGWGMPYAVTGMGGRNIVLRKVDGAEILRRIDGTASRCAARRPWSPWSSMPPPMGRPVPGRHRVRMVVAGAPPPTRTIERLETELGWEFVQIYGLTETSPLLTMNRAPAEWDELSRQSGRLNRAGAPAIGCGCASTGGELRARSNVVFDGYWQQPEATARRSSTAGSTPGTAASSTSRLRGDLGPQEGRDHHRRRERVVDRGRRRLFQHPDVTEAAVIGVPDDKWGEL